MSQFFEGLSIPALIGLGVIVVGAIFLVTVLLVNDMRERRSGWTWSSPWDNLKPEEKFSYKNDIQLTPENKARWLAEQRVLAATAFGDEYDEYGDRDPAQAEAEAEVIDGVEVIIPVSPGRPPLRPTASVAVVHERVTHMRTTETTFIFETEPVPFVHPLAFDPQDEILPWWHRLIGDTNTIEIAGLAIAPMPRTRRPVGCHHLTEASGADTQRALTAQTGQFDAAQVRALLSR